MVFKADYYVAEVPVFPGCLTQGETREEETITTIKEAIEGRLEVMEANQVIDPANLIEVSV